jgi:hypothetical protein
MRVAATGGCVGRLRARLGKRNNPRASHARVRKGAPRTGFTGDLLCFAFHAKGK